MSTSLLVEDSPSVLAASEEFLSLNVCKAIASSGKKSLVVTFEIGTVECF